MLNRRTLLQLLALGAASGSLPAPAVAARPTQQPLRWSNWSGNQRCQPRAILAPATIAELQTLLADSAGAVRPLGAGHSFSALVPSTGNLVTLARLAGMCTHDNQAGTATFYAGTQLWALGEPLARIGQAMINMPDIDEQLLAGAMATGTHGTGATLQALPAAIESLELVTASGDTLHCSPQSRPDVLQAARVSLGALGFVTRLTLRTRPAYRLRGESWMQTWDETLEAADELAQQHRNFEFFYLPFSGYCLLRSHDETEHPVQRQATSDDNDALQDLQHLRDYLGWSDTLRGLPIKMLAKAHAREVQIDESWKLYTSERSVRFNEMEYHLPRAQGLAALSEIRTLIERHFKAVFFPIEVRYVKGDTAAWLSPFYQQDSLSIAVHRFYQEEQGPLFSAIEPIFRKYGGRPHWGKVNTLRGAELRAMYPHWDDFAAIRHELDPTGRLLNPYLTALFAASG